MPHRRSSSSSPILSPPLLIIILPIILLLFLFFALPPFLSFTSQLLRPTSVKKSWDSLNILFVLFAILCGVFAKRNDDDSPSEEEVETVRVRATGYEKPEKREDGSVSRQWYGFSENKIYDSPPIVRLQSPMAGVSRLRRSSSSYPDLRQESLWETDSDRYRFHFFDDFEIDKFRSPEKEQIPVENPDRQENVDKVGEDADVKEIQVDTVEIRSSSPQPPQPALKSPTRPATPPPPPPPPPATTRPKSRRTYQTVSRKEKQVSVEVDDNDITGSPSPPRPPSPPLPPPAPAVQTEGEHKRGRNQRRKSNVKREIEIMWASLLNQKKRKKKQRTTTTKVDHIHNEDNVSARQPPPPPPPPPLPPSVIHSWFKKGVGKNKKIHSVSTPPPPAPKPPPPPLTSSKRWSFRKPKIPPPPPPPPTIEPRRRRNAGRPPLPTRTSTFNNETLLNTGNQSPLIPIPPPPPPPFKIPEMKFTVRGDFVKIRSTNSSRCGSPEPEDEPKPKEDPVEMEMGGTIPCPSPDVNVKAATFIARLRGEWKLEKINSMKEKQNLGLYGPGPMRRPSSSWH